MIEKHKTNQMSRTEKLVPPRWHEKVLQKRLVTITAGKGKFLSLVQLKSRLAR